MQILISDIFVPPRARKLHEKVPEMAQSLKDHGQITAIAVRPVDENDKADARYSGQTWALVAGGRRLAGSIMAGFDSIRGDSLDELSPYARLKIELEENLQREDMHFADVLEAKARLHELYKEENPEQRIEDTAAAIGESTANLSRDLALAAELRAKPELRKAGSKKAAAQAVKTASYTRAATLRLEGQGRNVNKLAEKIVTADMRTWLRTLETGSVDLLSADLPYGIDYFELAVDASNEATGHLSRFDDSSEAMRDLVVDVVPQLLRVTREEGWLALMAGEEGIDYIRKLISECCVTHFDYCDFDGDNKCMTARKQRKPSPCSYLKLAPKDWIWYRPNSRNNSMHPSLHAQNQYESILIVNRGKGQIISTERVGNVLVYDSNYSERWHAHQKPIELWMDVLSRFLVPGSLVVDPCYGSGSALAAAARLGMDFRGCDSNPAMLEPAIGFVMQYYQGELTR